MYDGDIESLLSARCGECHSGAKPAAGWAVTPYLRAIGCSDLRPDQPVSRPPAPRADLLFVLRDPTHSDLLAPDELARLTQWVVAGVPLRKLSVHPPGILDPESDDWHGHLAAEDDWGPITDPTHPNACGRCHAGAPVTPEHVQSPAPGAPACTSCHTQPGGVLACGTCHGDGTRAEPPRDPCFFADRAGAHAAHLHPSHGLGLPVLTCGDCHPKADATLSGTHADGHVDVKISLALAGPNAHYDPETGRCAVYCHNQGGAQPEPRWQTPSSTIGCGNCHVTPPPDHYAGLCSSCHPDVNDDGTALVSTKLHLNGRVDAGNGSGTCGACHGHGNDPWPDTPSHVLHHTTHLTAAIECSECHRVPKHVDDPGHLDRGTVTPADVTFGPRAALRGRHPMYATGRCTEVACHGAGLPEGKTIDVAWDSPARDDATRCTRCHGAPPTVDHTQSKTCSALICHGGEIASSADGPRISEAGRAVHIDGNIDAHPP